MNPNNQEVTDPVTGEKYTLPVTKFEVRPSFNAARQIDDDDETDDYAEKINSISDKIELARQSGDAARVAKLTAKRDSWKKLMLGSLRSMRASPAENIHAAQGSAAGLSRKMEEIAAQKSKSQ